MSQQDIEAIELNIKSARELVEMGKCLARLEKNRDFKKLILTRYLKDEAVRLVHLKAAPNAQNEKIQAAIVRDIDSIGALEGFFNSIFHEAQRAAEAIAESEDELEIARAEATEEGAE